MRGPDGNIGCMKIISGVDLPAPWVEDQWTVSQSEAIGELFVRVPQLFAADGKSSMQDQADKIVWFRLRNIETGVQVILELVNESQGRVPVNTQANYQPMGIFFWANGTLLPLNGTDLRILPLKTICNAISERLEYGTIAENRMALVNSALSDWPYPVWDDYDAGVGDEPLPVEYSRRKWFYAAVGYQYDYLAKKYPNENIADKMIAINSGVAAKSTVQGWITKARKMNLLAPARLVK